VEFFSLIDIKGERRKKKKGKMWLGLDKKV
jgi:hypothetical protein